MQFEKPGCATTAYPRSMWPRTANPDISCRTCQKRHHTLLHYTATPSAAAGLKDDSNPFDDEKISGLCAESTLPTPAVANVSRGSIIFLCTVQLPCLDKTGEMIHLRAMLDTGSQISPITRSAAEQLGLDLTTSTVTVRGIGSVRPQSTYGQVDLTAMTPGNRKYILSCDVLEQVVGNMCTARFSANFMDKFSGYELADPTFHVATHIDVLVGMVHYPDLVLPDRLQVDNMWLLKTLFGWAVTGRPSKSQSSPTTADVVASGPLISSPVTRRNDSLFHVLTADRDLAELQKFWENEETPSSEVRRQTPEENDAQRHFDETSYQDHTGRMIVQLPFIPEATPLGASKPQAVKRFLNLEARFKREPLFKEKYTEFINEFIELGHLELVPPDELDLPDSECYYFPHHGVFKESSTTTKLRVVFDGSAKTTTGVSLNDVLQVGPRTQDEIFKILTRMRFHLVAITGDVAKMYRQVALEKSSRDYHRILWRSDGERPLQVYRMRRVVYGIASSSFHAITTLQLAASYSDDPLVRRAIAEDFYVDDLLSGADSDNDARRLCDGLTVALARVGFPYPQMGYQFLRSA